MNSVSSTCQNCKKDFTIEPEDFDFYGKINVPAPTFCPSCRMQRRMMFRNERVLYKRSCDLCGKPMVSILSPDKPQKVYCNPCWWSDKWDSEEYAMEYDPTRNFFEQFKELSQKVPFPALIVEYSKLVNSEYTNHTGSLKDCYFVFNGDSSENTLYSTTIANVKDSMEVIMCVNGELCYDSIDISGSQVFFSENCSSCVSTYFSKNCVGLVNCFGCVNLRNKSYCMWNEQLTKEDYEKRMSEMKLDSYAFVEETRKKAREFWLKFPVKFMYALRNNDVSGDYIYECKNSHVMYQALGCEDCKYCQFMTMPTTKDTYDITEWGNNLNLCYDAVTVGGGASNIKFSFGVWESVSDIEYSFYIIGGTRMFGCVGMRKKENCILNKQYTKEEYEALKAKIISDMKVVPYVDSKGRKFSYGDFFPYDLSLYDYNEAYVHDYFPLKEEEIKENGWRFKEKKANDYTITLPAEKIPDSINEIDEGVLKEVFGCGNCGKAFKVVSAELAFLKRFKFPLHRNCPDCRHAEKIKRINSPKLWNRECAKCKASIETSYSPERTEIVYCEACYQAEVG